ncbi:hypothetical protein OF001_U310018 [Pseudomonas sp. OF001]|nr:hypothetical protein OF001_U310018 [Pseudomonas sp. OF001]
MPPGLCRESLARLSVLPSVRLEAAAVRLSGSWQSAARRPDTALAACRCGFLAVYCLPQLRFSGASARCFSVVFGCARMSV